MTRIMVRLMQLTLMPAIAAGPRRIIGPAWKILLLLASALMSANAAAQCAAGSTCISGTGPTATVVVTGRINVSPDTPPGAVISDKIPAADYVIKVTQNGAPDVSASASFEIVAGNLVSGYTDVYKTNIAGIGVRYYLTLPPDSSANPDITGVRTIANSRFQWTFAPPVDGGVWPINVGRAVQFINLTQGAKTGTVTTVPVVNVVTRVSIAPGNSWNQVQAFNGMVTGGTIATRTCTLQPIPDILLPQVPARDLPSMGSSAAPHNFSISANCSGPLLFALRFSAATNFENASISLLKNTLADTSGAKGYAIQIVEGGTDASIDANTKVYQTTVESSTFTQDFTARYYRFAANPTGGRIQSMLIYTLDYR